MQMQPLIHVGKADPGKPLRRLFRRAAHVKATAVVAQEQLDIRALEPALHGNGNAPAVCRSVYDGVLRQRLEREARDLAAERLRLKPVFHLEHSGVADFLQREIVPQVFDLRRDWDQLLLFDQRMAQERGQRGNSLLQHRHVVELRDEPQAAQRIEQEMRIDLILQHFQLELPFLPLIRGVLDAQLLHFCNHIVDGAGQKAQLVLALVVDRFIQIGVRRDVAHGNHMVDRLHDAGIYDRRAEQAQHDQQDADQNQGAVDLPCFLRKIALRNGNDEIAVQLTVINGDRKRLYAAREDRRGDGLTGSGLCGGAELSKRAAVQIAGAKQGFILRGDDLTGFIQKHDVGACAERNVGKQCVADKALVDVSQNVADGPLDASEFVYFSAQHDLVIVAVGPDILQGIISDGFVDHAQHLGEALARNIVVAEVVQNVVIAVDHADILEIGGLERDHPQRVRDLVHAFGVERERRLLLRGQRVLHCVCDGNGVQIAAEFVQLRDEILIQQIRGLLRRLPELAGHGPRVDAGGVKPDAERRHQRQQQERGKQAVSDAHMTQCAHNRKASGRGFFHGSPLHPIYF